MTPRPVVPSAAGARASLLYPLTPDKWGGQLSCALTLEAGSPVPLTPGQGGAVLLRSHSGSALPSAQADKGQG